MAGASGGRRHAQAVLVSTITAFHRRVRPQAPDRALSDQASLLEPAHDAILVRDAGQVIPFWNRGAERTYGSPAVSGAEIFLALARPLPWDPSPLSSGNRDGRR
jgi:PAS domain-containing protein